VADVNKEWEAGCVPHGARVVDGSGADAEGGFRHPQPNAADVERERVTALWREASDALEPAARAEALRRAELLADRWYWDLCISKGASEDQVADFARRSLAALAAECGRLREQLDALAEAAKPLANLPYPVSKDERTDWLTYQQRLRAALGVEGRDE
jgi:hypothetical protein